MDSLKLQLSNCYGIASLDEELNFSGRKKTNAIYAPNGLMKTSFSKTFEALSKGEQPTDERFPSRTTTCLVEDDGVRIDKDKIYVLKSNIDISSDTDSVTNILINQATKTRYDALVKDLSRIQAKLINALNKKSKVRKSNVEDQLGKDFHKSDFIQCIKAANDYPLSEDYGDFYYEDIFNAKALEVIEKEAFTSKADEFNQKYDELFTQSGGVYKKGIFNPVKAENSFSTLDKNGFFNGGHRVHLSGDESSIGYEELQEKIEAIHKTIDSDETLKSIRVDLAKNAQTQALISMFENLPAEKVELLLTKIKPENQAVFRQELWAFYIQNCSDTASLLDEYENNKDEITRIETEAATEAPGWLEAIEVFNNRFVDMPFTLSLYNPSEAALGKEKAKLKFIFKEGTEEVECERNQVKSLSQGEMRALYLLNFIFDVEDRKSNSQETLFIVDDAADSFDYKNKHAIVQYLRDIHGVDFFYQIILTHNFDFFRTLANSFVRREACLMANRNANKIEFSQAKVINNYFVTYWKTRVSSDNCILCASVAFTRNIIEYTQGEEDSNYLKLTSLLHWKSDTDQITVGGYYGIYNTVFGTSHDDTNTKPFIDLLFEQADTISARTQHDGLNLEDKVVLSMAIRLKAEMFLTNELRTLKGDSSYWCLKKNQFGNLMKEYTQADPTNSAIKSLEKVSITVSSNIHLNSFMYEPILDLTIEHLIELYSEIKGLLP
jgi:hypothetical protein